MSAKKVVDERAERIAKLKAALDKLDPTAVVNLESTTPVPVEKLPTGVLGIDAILGGGVPLGRIIEVFGNEGSGKTTLCSHLVASAQQRGAIATYIDVEHAYDMTYAASIGVDPAAIIFSQPSNGEKAFDLAIQAAEDGNPGDIIVIDSMAAIVPQAELEGDMSDQFIGLQARVLGKGFRKINGILEKKKVTLICINQMREKVGVFYGDKETTPGGKALKFYSSQRIQLIACGKVKEEEGDKKDITGQEVIVKTIKNKVFVPFRQVKLPLIFGKGFSKMDSLLELALEHKLIVREGPYYTVFAINDEGQVATELQKLKGMEAVVEFYKGNSEELLRLESAVKARVL